ncbi:UNVERIFIED_CONTAM: U-box domain-containing protein 32 [Sesamum calycinum]|uniref:RING-type E3 ubiquitin transferase n=1 Tax=Sesamum calycinum TaxID=2727403 RepID=A0AAW2QVK1_9LAMI
MGSEGESSDFNSPLYVAVGRNVKEGKSLLTWALENFDGRNICLVHVHQPTNLVSLLNGKLSTSKLKNHVVKACREFERLKIQKLMNQYLLFLSQTGKQADTVWIEMRNIEKGILQLITQHSIRRLIMGAGAETFKSKILSETNSTKAMVVCQQAPISCHIWPVGFGSHLTTTVTLSPSTSSSGTILARDPKENMDVGAENVQYFELPNRSIDDVVSTMSPSAPTVGQTSGGGSPSPLKVERPAYLTCSSSNTSLDSEFQDEEICDLRNKLEHTMIDAENSKHRTIEESLRWWRAEEDALEAMHKAEAAENLCKEETNRCKEMEELLHRQKQEMETMKSQHDQVSKELQLIQDQKPALESQLRQAYDSEKELEDKIIQAVNLLITFKGTRDRLQIEYDSAIRKVNKYRALQKEDPLGISSAHFFGISFSDIIEATQNFKPSQKIGEGRYGSVFKGVLCHVKVAIKMLPSMGSQSDSEFKNEVEFLSRVRHPNLVTLIGACPESRSLVYEYIENGSLEDYLSGRAKSGSLSWQSRIKIAIDICSAILFLHANNICCVHGNLKPSDILLDANFVTKISDYGINNLISENENPSSFHTLGSKNDPEKLAYMDPESFENGKLTTESDVYSFGVILLRLLTARPAMSVIRDVKCAMERGNLDAVLDTSAGEWPLKQAKQLAHLALRCCEEDPMDRPDLASEIWAVLEPMRELCNSSQITSTASFMDSRSQHKIPSHFVCPIYQEVMKDPHIAGDGFTYEAEAIRGWFNSGHKTSPMTNLKLDNCDLLPNYALYYAIQEWQQNT